MRKFVGAKLNPQQLVEIRGVALANELVVQLPRLPSANRRINDRSTAKTCVKPIERSHEGHRAAIIGWMSIAAMEPLLPDYDQIIENLATEVVTKADTIAGAAAPRPVTKLY